MSILHNFLKSLTACEALPALPPTPIINNLPLSFLKFLRILIISNTFFLSSLAKDFVTLSLNLKLLRNDQTTNTRSARKLKNVSQQKINFLTQNPQQQI